MSTETAQDTRAGDAAMVGQRADELGGATSLRSRVAKGTIINGIYQVGLNGLGLLRGFVAAALLTTAEFGVWGILAITLGTFLSLRHVGVGEKFVQQDEADQERAFQRAFGVEVVFTALFAALMAVSIPLLSLLYNEPSIVAPGLALVAVLPAFALQSPIWVYYRRLQFGRQRLLQGVDPIVTFVVTVVLAALGLGYWSLVVGALCGAWSTAVVAIRFSPYRLRVQIDRGVLREYGGFSVPLLVAATSTLIAAQASLLVADRALGLAAAGAVYLAVTISFYVYKLDEVVVQSLYPAICAVRDRVDLLRESFLKSNQFAMLWGVPFGVGVALFAGDLIEFALGEKWRLAEDPIRVFALIAAANQIGFNWNAFMQAKGRTVPIAVAAVTSLVLTGSIALPLLALEGLLAFALGMALAAVVLVAQRLYYLRSMFPLGGIVGNASRAAIPTAVATALVLGIRAVEGDGRSLELAITEATLFAGTVAVLTLHLHRSLLTEILGYLRERKPTPTPPMR